jgi:hypothetical protein
MIFVLIMTAVYDLKLLPDVNLMWEIHSFVVFAGGRETCTFFLRIE